MVGIIMFMEKIDEDVKEGNDGSDIVEQEVVENKQDPMITSETVRELDEDKEI